MKIPPYQIDSFIKTIAQNKEIFAALIYGPESGLAAIRTKAIGQAIVANLSDPFLVTNLSEAQVNEDDAILYDEFVSIPMLGGRKLITVRNPKEKLADTLKTIFEDKKPTEGNFILITAGELDASSKLRKLAEANPYIASLACYEDDSKTISQIVRQKLNEAGIKTNDEVIQLITEKFGKNRLIILNEIEKIIAYLGEEKNLTLEIALELSTDLSESSLSEFTNYFLDCNNKKAINALQKLYDDKTYPITIIRTLSSYLMRIYTVKNNLINGANLENEIKAQRLFFKQEPIFRKQVNYWPIDAINELLFKLQELEAKCKSSNSIPELLLSHFVNLSCLKFGKIIKKTN